MRETSASEPPSKHRNAFRRHQNWGFTTTSGRVWRGPTNWPCGVRCIGGVTLILGSCTELENLAGDAKGESTSGEPARLKVPMRRRGADCPVLVMKRV